MNIRKAVDYSTMFATLESVMKADLPQMELYCEIGKAVCAHSEKGAAVAAAEFIKEQYPDMTGFSPRNVRRMRDFYRMYGEEPDLLKLAMEISWTHNVVILEAELNLEERRWYLRAVGQFGWSKAELQRKIDSNAHLEIQLDELEIQCYTELNRNDLERTEYDQDTFPLSRQYLQKSDGRVYYERFGEKGRFGTGNYYRIGSYQHRRDWKSCLSTGPPQAGRA